MWAEPGSADAARLDRTDVTQPALFALQVALHRQLAALGVRPDALLGHSIGELSAAHVAGVLTLPDAARLVAARGRLMAAVPEGGVMLSVPAAEAAVRESLAGYADRLVVAAVNGPKAVVVSGAADAAAEWAEQWRAAGGAARPLRVSHAFHSPLMAPMLAEFAEVARSVAYAAPQVPIMSTVTGGPLDAAGVDWAEHWVEQVSRPVRFLDGVRALEAAGTRRWLELGPDGVLCSLARDCLAEPPGALVPALRAGRPELRSLLGALAELHVDGAAVDWSAAPGGSAAPAGLPTYAFQRRRFWAVPAGGGPAPGVPGTGHPLVGAALPVAGTGEVLLAGRVGLATHPWLADHAVAGTPLLSGTCLVELALRAGAEVGADLLRELTVEAPLALPADDPVDLQVRLGEPAADGGRPVAVWARAGDGAWVRHAQGVVAPAGPSDDHPAAPAPASGAGPSGGGPAAADQPGGAGPSGGEPATPDWAGGTWPPAGAGPVDLTEQYAALDAAGLSYGPAFRRVRAAWRLGADVYAEVAAEPGFVVDPVALDAALHASVPTTGETVVPFGWTGVRAGRGDGPLWRVRVAPAGPDRVGLVAVDGTGAPVASVAAVLGRPLGEVATAGRLGDSLFRLRWEPVGPAGPAGTLPTAAEARAAETAPAAALLALPPAADPGRRPGRGGRAGGAGDRGGPAGVAGRPAARRHPAAAGDPRRGGDRAGRGPGPGGRGGLRAGALGPGGAPGPLRAARHRAHRPPAHRAHRARRFP